MNKIVSTKGLGPNTNGSNKQGMSLDKYFFNLRIFNEYKIRASKKLKIPFSRVGLLFIL